MTTDNDIGLLEVILTHTLNAVDIDANGNAVERRYLVQSINKVKIEIYSQEHPPPHFHVKSSTINVTFSIEKCDLLKGEIDSKTKKKIEYFHSKHKDKLIDVWNKLRPTDCPVGKINT